MPPAIKTVGSFSAKSTLKATAVTTPAKALAPTLPPANNPVKATGIFDPKPGGTAVGNALRDVVSNVTDGHFGTGNMQQRDGETNEQYQNRIVQALGAGAESFNNSVKNNSNSNNMADSFKAGVTTEAVTNAIKTYAPTVILVGVGIFVVKKFILNGGRKGKRSY